jgi:hypothetical protein
MLELKLAYMDNAVKKLDNEMSDTRILLHRVKEGLLVCQSKHFSKEISQQTASW